MSDNREALRSVIEKVAKEIRMLGSDRPGEIEAAVAAMKRTLGSAGLDLNDFASCLTASDDTMPSLEFVLHNETDSGILFRLGKGATLFHTPNGAAFADAKVADGRENMPSPQQAVIAAL